MKKIKLVVAYDGTDFSGFQRQPGKRTIQGTLEETLSKITGEEIEIYGSGRTDAGVHALGQVCHFTTKSPIPITKYPYILRRALPRDIICISSEEVPMDFHARKSAYWKTYRYYIETTPVPDLFTRRFRTHLPFPLDVDAMQKAGKLLVGTHDFTSFCSTKTVVEDRVRTIYRCQVCQEANGVYIEVTGNGFLYNMVRIIAGTLYEVGRHERNVQEIPQILAAKDRTLAGPTFPPEGLILFEVGYTPWKESASNYLSM
ncbi:tRNA pseudouridine(38-40) synthase TruA [Thermoflavimicrobium dichotomicum]|uniref:tRNA pseudouridine synthase A n=1 Tax=Thermoflavimicrobium dichotomicum TaxID=46223 RepID=A0A1I3QY23_9BACL|nr:tRNA pseudouridine(38-40) synthase TruA [Thermoflavimicrobium dichotomicum]SFJ38805.1 tRNA pseudouridine38-40 synthase [Thermoflavimicrobium dichotomicum]